MADPRVTAVADAPPVTSAMMLAKVEKARSHGYRDGVIALYGRPDGDARDEMTSADQLVRIRPASSTLVVREALLEHEDGAWMVIITDCSERDLGAGVLAHFVGTRVQRPDPWESVQDAFDAVSIDPSLTGLPSSRDLASALLSARPAAGWPPAPAGVLTRAHAFAAVAATRLNLAQDAPDLVTVLEWSARPATKELIADLRSEHGDLLTSATLDWVAECAGVAAPVVRELLASDNLTDLLPLGLVLHLLTLDLPTTEERHDAKMALARTEHLWKPAKATPVQLSAIGTAATTVAADLSRSRNEAWLERILRRAEDLLGAAEAEQLATYSDLLTSGFRRRLASLAVALRRDIAEPSRDHARAVEASWEHVQRHRLGASKDSPEPSAFAAAVRLTRWLRTPPLGPDASLADRAHRHLTDDSWADSAINDAFTGVDGPHLTTALRDVLERATERRRLSDRAFAAALADATSSGVGLSDGGQDHSFGKVWHLEQLLPKCVIPLARSAAKQPEGNRGSLLLLVMDGMSAAVADEILDDAVTELGWIEAGLPGVTTHRSGALAVLPSLTEASRTSLLSGRLTTGSQANERTAYEALTAKLGSAKIFHKKGVDTTGPGALIADGLGAAIDDTAHTALVTVVLNTIDDALDRSDPGGITWTADAVKHLKPLLTRAKQAGRTVIITADHGHVIERRSGTQRSYPDISSGRSRAVTGEVEPGEVLVSGERVLTKEGQAVLAVDEDLRYGPLKAGYHGGASAAEVVVPVATLVPDENTNFFNLPLLPPQQPTWWQTGASDHFTNEQLSRDQPPRKKPAPGKARPPVPGPTLFEVETSTTPSEPRDAASDLGHAVVKSKVYATQRKIAGRVSVNDERVAAMITALSQAQSTRLPAATVASSLGVSERKLRFALAHVHKLLNVEGYPVVRTDADGTTIVLDVPLLRDQFEVA